MTNIAYDLTAWYSVFNLHSSQYVHALLVCGGDDSTSHPQSQFILSLRPDQTCLCEFVYSLSILKGSVCPIFQPFTPHAKGLKSDAKIGNLKNLIFVEGGEAWRERCVRVLGEGKLKLNLFVCYRKPFIYNNLNIFVIGIICHTWPLQEVCYAILVPSGALSTDQQNHRKVIKTRLTSIILHLEKNSNRNCLPLKKKKSSGIVGNNTSRPFDKTNNNIITSNRFFSLRLSLTLYIIRAGFFSTGQKSTRRTKKNIKNFLFTAIHDALEQKNINIFTFKQSAAKRLRGSA